jgi:hypothetical protein
MKAYILEDNAPPSNCSNRSLHCMATHHILSAERSRPIVYYMYHEGQLISVGLDAYYL